MLVAFDTFLLRTTVLPVRPDVVHCQTLLYGGPEFARGCKCLADIVRRLVGGLERIGSCEDVESVAGDGEIRLISH
jgi:hypothetical protein